MKTLSVGDETKVKHSKRGPVMTVTLVNSGSAVCVWWNRKKQCWDERSFPLEALLVWRGRWHNAASDRPQD